MSDNSGQSGQSAQGKRRALHQRSDSDTNANALSPISTPKRLSDEPDFIVATKNYSVSIWSSNSSKNVSAADIRQPGRHRRTQTDSSINMSSGHSRSNTRSTIQSTKSLDSLPPVPPLRFQKDPLVGDSGSASVPAAQTATPGYTGGQGGVDHEEAQSAHPRSSLRLPALPAPALSFHGLSNPESSGFNSSSSPASDPSPLRRPPKSILKKPSHESSNFADYEDNSSSFDPSSAVSETSSNRFPRNPRSSTSYEYLRRSRAWVGSAAVTDDSPNRERMNAHTLRVVPASSDAASFTTEDSYAVDIFPTGLGVRGGTIRPVAPSHERKESQVSTSSSLGGETEVKVAGLPAWTRQVGCFLVAQKTKFGDIY